MEKWRRLNSPFHRYEVSSYGYVRNRETKRLATLHSNRNGYIYVMLYVSPYTNRNGRRQYRRTVSVSPLVASQFLPPKPEGKQIDHWDDNKHNNYANNLHWVTQKYNIKKSYKNNPERPRQGHSRPYLTPKQYNRIILLSATNQLSQCVIARIVGCDNSTVSKILGGKIRCWRRN